MSFIQANLDNYTVKQMCKVLKFPRSTYYAVINHVISQREIDYNKFSDEVKYYYDKSKGRYGAIKIQRDLEEAGIPCSVKRVQRHMAKLGLRSVVVRKYKYQNNQGKVPDDKENILNRDFTTTTINQKWVTDITYIHVLKEGWTYLASVMDLYNRKIIGYSYGKNPTAELAKKAVENACLNVEDTTGIILHSDLGSQYTSAVFEDMLIEKNMKHSFSRKGNPYDNACMESFHSVLKKEEVYLNTYHTFKEAKLPQGKDIEKVFQSEVLKMLKKEGKINQFIIDNMLSWENTGFNVYCGEAIYAEEQESIEKLAQYVVRAPISQERMFYIPPEESSNEVGKIIYKGKNSREIQAFDALDWLARLVTHIPNKGEQFVRYYGYYSNKSRGQRKKAETDDKVPAIVSSDLSKKAFRKNWARLIQKVYNVDPLKCKYCNGKMRIISFVEDEETIEKILKHLKLWGIQNHDPPNHFKIPQQFEHFILANSLLIGNNEKSNENMGKNKDGNYEEHNSNNVFPDYETCDEMPKYEDWF